MNVTGRFHTNYGDAPGRYAHIGVLDYVVNNTVNAANIPSLISLFVDRGVSVNLRTTKDEVAGITPLDSLITNITHATVIILCLPPILSGRSAASVFPLV
ncbi:MAG: hypothetical protein R1F54_06000 [Candidatus Zeuxoniibacter abyssi]|nr:MAG: hypothetical protein R1F54_06000 [Candidatus Persebacteraceae bacterium AB1(2)]